MSGSLLGELDVQPRDPVRERDNLVAAIAPLMSTLNFYAGPGARSAVSQDSVRSYERLWLALRRAQGEACPRCDDTGRWKGMTNPHPCPLRFESGHENVVLPEDVIAHMVQCRDADRAEDANPNPERGYRVGPPRYEAELAGMGVE